MNTWFWIIAGAMLVLALVILIRPLLSKQALRSQDGSQRNLRIARQQLAELQQQHLDGVLSQDQFDAQYLELQQNLHDNLDDDNSAPHAGGSGRWIIGLIVVLLPLLSIALYLQLGDADAIAKAEMQAENERSLAQVREMIPQIIERLKQNPNDLQGWLMLGRSYMYLEQYTEAAGVYAKLYQFQPDNLEVMLDYANSLAMSRNGELNGLTGELIFKALQLAPDNHNALWLAGMAKAQSGEGGQAIVYWQKLAGLLPPDSSNLPQVQQMIAEVTAQMAAESAPASAAPITNNIHVNVAIAAEYKARAQSGQTLFIYAQAVSGPKMPLAIVRKQVGDLPLTVDLNDSLAMQPGLHLADFPKLKIVARISQSGDAISRAGDFIGSVELGQLLADQTVNININQEVK